MVSKKIKVAIISALFFFLLPSGLATAKSDPISLLATDCSEYYNPQLIQSEFQVTPKKSMPGIELSFHALLTNKNTVPISDGMVYAKILRAGKESEINLNQHYAYDQFIVRDHISLKADEALDLTFTWRVPMHLPAGQYQAILYFVPLSQSFNFLQLDYTMVNQAFFDVQNTSEITFDYGQSDVMVNGKKFVAGLTLEKLEDIEVNFLLKNTSESPLVVPIVWNLYKDGELSQLANHKEENLYFAPDSSVNATYAKTSLENSKYYLVGQIDYKGTKHYIDLPIQLKEAATVNLSLLGFSSLPLVQKENELFICLKPSGSFVHNGVNKEVNLGIEISDLKGNVLGSFESKVDLRSSAYKASFTPIKKSSDFTVQVSLKEDDNIARQWQIQFRNQKDGTYLYWLTTWQTQLKYLLVLLILGLILAATLIIQKNKGKGNDYV